MFSDIANHWAAPCIVALARRDLIRGYPGGFFRPLAVITRAEMAALLQKVFAQLPVKQEAAVFADVPSQYWASEAIAWASAGGLFSGYGDGRFRPQQMFSRVEAITVLIRGLEAMQGIDLEMEAAGEALPSAHFSDADQIPAYGWEAIAAALARRLLEPLPEKRPLRPQQALTRGELTALLCRMITIPAVELVPDRPALKADQQRGEFFKPFLDQEIGFNAEQLAFLDRGIGPSPLRDRIANYPLWLQSPGGIGMPLTKAAAYPKRGEVFFVNEEGLDFLDPDLLSACVCLASWRQGQLEARWLGRDALSDRQLWSATKFIPLLNVAARANAIAPYTDIDRTLVRRAGGQGGYPFHDLAAGIMSYDNRIATSNALAVTFKQFETPERLEQWTQQLTGNQELSFQGRYGEVPFIEYPELWDRDRKQVLLKSAKAVHQGENLLSTYDLTRLITMLGWHWHLPAAARIPGIQSHSVESIIRAMGVDTARYGEIALETLGVLSQVRSPVVISKSGFGRSDQRDRTELTYCALVQFELPRDNAPDPTASHQRYSLGMTLIASKQSQTPDEEARYVDALMAASVTEILRRLILGQLA